MEINLNSKRVTLKTAKKYCPEDISLNVSLQDKAVTPAATEQTVAPDTGYAGLGTVTVAAVATESGAATPSAAAQVITPSEGKLFDKFTVNATPTETKSVTPTTTEQTVTPTEGKFLSSVSVAAIVVEEKTATPTAAAQDVTPSAGKYLSKVTVNATPTEQKTITGNGTFTPSTGKFFDSVTVNVNTAKPEQEKSVDLTTMTPVDITPDEGYTLSKVTATPKAPLADTSDATATTNDILFGKTAYAKGRKIAGGITGPAGGKKVIFKQTLPGLTEFNFPGVMQTDVGWIAFENIFISFDAMQLRLYSADTASYSMFQIYSTDSGWTRGLTRTAIFKTENNLSDYTDYFDGDPVSVDTFASVSNVTGGEYNTKGYYFKENIKIYPSTTELYVTPSTSIQTKLSTDGYVGYSKVIVRPAPLDAAKTVTAGTTATTVNPTGSNIGIKSVTVEPTPSSAKTVTPTKETQTVSPDGGKLLSGVTVNPIPDAYIIPSGTKDITANGTADVTSFASVNVAVPAPDLSDATAVPSKILLGATAYTGAGKITGTIPTYDGSLRAEPIVEKGTLITIESKQYRAIKVNGNVVEVLAMYDATRTLAFNASKDSNVYEDSSLDVYLSQTFYNSLSTAMQNAIVTKTFTQDSWDNTSGSSGGTGTAIYQGLYASGNPYRIWLTNAAYGSYISRNCYALSCQDVIDYLEVTTSMTTANTTLTSVNLWKMFWNRTTSPGSEYILLRSASNATPPEDVYCAYEYSGDLSTNYVGKPSYKVRPAFQIDLSKITWTK